MQLKCMKGSDVEWFWMRKMEKKKGCSLLFSIVIAIEKGIRRDQDKRPAKKRFCLLPYADDLVLLAKVEMKKKRLQLNTENNVF